MISPGILAVDEDEFQRVQVPSPRAVALLGDSPEKEGSVLRGAASSDCVEAAGIEPATRRKQNPKRVLR
jgi:hypothetical protein